MAIEIYLKSQSYNRDVRHQVRETKFVSCAQTRTYLPEAGWEGRLFEQDSQAILQLLDKLPVNFTNTLYFVDAGSLSGRLKAWRAGVREFPALVTEGQKYSGVGQVRLILTQMSTETAPNV